MEFEDLESLRKNSPAWKRVQRLDAIGDTDPRMRHIHYGWMDAAERTQSTAKLLSEQLRCFLDDQVVGVLDRVGDQSLGDARARPQRDPVTLSR